MKYLNTLSQIINFLKRIKKTKYEIRNTNSGYILPALLITVAIFSIILYGLANLVANQYIITHRQTASQQALQIAEAGINYYRWHLAHAPNDFTDATGNPGPYVHDYIDPQGGVEGQFSLEITPPQSGSSIVTIKSTGWHADYPDVTRTITARYGEPSMAQYVFLHDNSIWLGSGLETFGPVHSNGGIRQDGINHSTVTSSLDTYTCGSETGCNPAQTMPAIWGAGGDSGLWQFPQTPVDFGAISVDFSNMKIAAQNEGVYLPGSGSWGYQVIFNGDGTVSIYRVTSTGNRPGYDSDGGCQNLYQRITGTSLVNIYNQADVPIIFAEDTLWVQGTITSPTEIVAARFPVDTSTTDIWINDNLEYATLDGSIQAGLIAQTDIMFARNIPDDFVINAALLAQQGKIFRHHYDVWWCATSGHAVKNSLTIYGSVISSLKSYWNWGASPSSGFSTRDVTYDANLLYSPPPYFPTTGEYEFISWTE